MSGVRFQGSAQPPAVEAASLIEEETFFELDEIMNMPALAPLIVGAASSRD